MNTNTNTASQLSKTAASPILARYEPASETIERASKNDNALQLIDDLVEDREFHSAIEFLCYWMPPQYVVWWGCLCIWEVEREQDSPALTTALGLIIAWLQNPNEDHRLELQQVDSLYKPKHPINLISKAALRSSGSMSAPDSPPVAPPKYLFSIFASSAIQLIAVAGTPENFGTRNKQIIRLGMEVLQGVNHWQLEKQAG